MDKQNLNFFGIFGILIIILLGVFVLAAVSAPTALKFTQNTTVNFDKDGTFHLNWTNGTTDTGNNTYVIYIYQDDVLNNNSVNHSAKGFIFINTTDANYTFTVESNNGTTKTNSSNISMIVDTTDPVVSYTTGTPADNAFSNTLTSIFVNVSVTEANNDSLVFSLYNTTAVVNETVYLTSTILTINFTGLPVNVVYSYNVTVNDSATRSFTAATRTFTLDNVAPSPSLTKTSSGQTSLELSISGKEGTCTVDRSGATISGSTVTETGLSCGNSYSYIVTCTDTAGNAGSSSAASFSTTGCSSSGTGGTTTPQPKKASYSFSKITPGNVSIMKNFDAETGVKVIQINVNNEVQNVKITVTKYDNKPAEVSVEKTGKVYQYLQIAATNLGNNLDKAIVQFKVEKSWISSNGLDKDKISVFKFNENSKEWNELLTVYNSSDNTYDFFDVELTSFSFFAISEKTVVVVEDEDEASLENGETSTTGGTEKGNLKWLWIVVVVLVVLFVVAIMNREKLIWFEK